VNLVSTQLPKEPPFALTVLLGTFLSEEQQPAPLARVGFSMKNLAVTALAQVAGAGRGPLDLKLPWRALIV
jgi:hypothetical protein